jgi:prepilin-type N-terminal cleavage/methylation domain-containing protein
MRIRTAALPPRRLARGFSLVELAVVMAIVGLMLGGLMYTLSAQTEQRNFEETRRRLDQARELVLASAIVKGRLPCPARYTSSASHSQGLESFCTAAATSSTSTCAGSETTTEQAHGTCSEHFSGYLPAASIGYAQTDASGFAVDAWGNRIRYVVTRTNTNCSGTSLPPNSYTTMYTSKTYLQTYGISCQPNDLLVCKSGTGITGTDCGTAANQIMATSLVVAIVYSTGKNFATAPDATSATAAGRTDEAANLNGDRVFVFHTPNPSGATGGEFDDQFTWITVGELYGRMVAAGVLP